MLYQGLNIFVWISINLYENISDFKHYNVGERLYVCVRIKMKYERINKKTNLG